MIKNILNTVSSRTTAQRGLKRGDNLSLYLRVDGTVDYVGVKRFQTVISENDDTHSIRRTLIGQSYAPNDDTDMMVVRVQSIDENHLNVSFPYHVLGIKPGPATLGESAILYLP